MSWCGTVTTSKAAPEARLTPQVSSRSFWRNIHRSLYLRLSELAFALFHGLAQYKMNAKAGGVPSCALMGHGVNGDGQKLATCSSRPGAW